MIMGDLESEHLTATMLGERVRAVVVAVDCRLAPELTFPAGPEDCYAGLVWMCERVEELGCDPDRVASYGNSAGHAIRSAPLASGSHGRIPSLPWRLPWGRSLRPDSALAKRIWATRLEALNRALNQ
jgi:acetyl esterase/lipase